jgi:PAS domain S-box-containing protein
MGAPALLHVLSQMVLASRFPMFLLWGPKRRLLYNDAYRPILGGRHPKAMGQTFAEVWPEIAGEIGPLIDLAWAGESCLFEDYPVTLHRDDGPGEAFFDFSYSPVADENGAVQAVLCVCKETTTEVRSARRRGFWDRFEAMLRDLADPTEIIRAAQAALGEYLGVDRLGYAEFDDEARRSAVAPDWTAGGPAPAIQGEVALGDFGEAVLTVASRGETLAIDDVATDARVPASGRALFATLGSRAVAAVHLIKDGRLRAALHAHARSPRAWTGEDLRMLEGAAGRTWSAIERARAEMALRESEARFRAMADIAPAPVWVTSAAGPVEFVNLAFARVAGRPREELLGETWGEIIHQDDLVPVSQARAKARAKAAPYVFEARFRTAGDEWRVMQAHSQPRFDDDGRFAGYVGLAVDITDIRAAEARQQLLINELNHRVKNTLATVQSLAHQTLREGTSMRDARRSLTDRLMALSAAHNILTQTKWTGAPLDELAAEALHPFRGFGRERIEVDCEACWLAPHTALSFSMALHELATNAVKHGALSGPDGRVSLRGRAVGETLELVWEEAAGPPVKAPAAAGFGLRLLQRGLSAEFGSSANLEFRPEGVLCTLRAPLGRPASDERESVKASD